jgi:hypothetical protein
MISPLKAQSRPEGFRLFDRCIAVTGGDGILGRNVVWALRNRGCSHAVIPSIHEVIKELGVLRSKPQSLEVLKTQRHNLFESLRLWVFEFKSSSTSKVEGRFTQA